MTEDSHPLRRATLSLLAIGVGGFLADYLYNIGLTNLLDPHDYGDYRVAHSFAAICGVAVLLGGDRLAPKVLAGPLDRGEPTVVAEYLRFYAGVALLLSLLVMAGTWLASWLHVGSSDPHHHHVLAWVVLSVPFSAAGALVSRTLQSARLQTTAALPWRVIHPLLTLGLVAIAVWALGEVSVQLVVVLSIVAVVLVTGWQWLVLRRRVVAQLPRNPAARAAKPWLSLSLPMMGAFLITIALSQSDLYFLELLGNEHDVGHYAAAMTTAHFLIIVQTSVIGIVAPLIAAALEKGRAAATPVRARGLRMMVACVLPVGAALVLAGRPILSLFGSAYTDAWSALAWLVLANSMWALAALGVLWLQYTGRGPAVIATSAAILAVDSALNALLIPRFHMLGAAVSTAATLTAAAVAVGLLVRSGASRDESNGDDPRSNA